MSDTKEYANMEIRSLAVWDYLVFVAVLVVSAGIGVFHAFRGGRQKTTAEFLLADRKMSLLPVAISILVSGMSAILILGSPAEMYTAGTMFMTNLLSFPLSLIGINLFIPLFHPLKLTSAFEYLELRFNSKAVKRIATIQLIFAQVLYMGVASFAPSTALEAVTGFPAWATIVLCMSVATFYTTIGGLKAVVWTDVFQSVIMLAGMLAILIQGSIKVGGFTEVWRLNLEWDRVEFFDFNPDPTVRHTFWSLVFGGFLGFVGGMGTSQVAVQRYSALPTVRDAQKASALNIVMAVGLILISCLTGVVLFAYYAKKDCDPLSSGYISNSNQLVPFFVMDVLGYPGLPGLFLAAIFSGALSSISSSLSALSAVTWDAFFQDWCANLKESWKALITKGLVIAFGALGVGVAFAAQFLKGTVLQASLSFSGAAYGPQLGLYILAGFFPWANWIGCIAGGICGLVMALWLVLGAYFHRGGPTTNLLYPNASCPVLNMTDSLTTTMIMDIATEAPAGLSDGLNSFYSISYLYYTTYGGLIAVIVGLAVSFATGPTDPRDVNPKYLVPFFDRLCCCFPERWRERLRCGIAFKTPQEVERERNEKELVVLADGNDSTKKDSSPNMNNSTSKLHLGTKVYPELPSYEETDLITYDVAGNYIPDENQRIAL